MQHHENKMLDQRVIDEKNGVLQQFFENAKQLSDAKTHADITRLTALHNIYKEQLDKLRHQGLVTREEASTITETFNTLSNNKYLIKSKCFDYFQAYQDFRTWKSYSGEVNLPELLATLPDRFALVIERYKQDDTDTKHEKDNYDEKLMLDTRIMIKGYERKNISKEQINPIVTIMVEFYLQIMNITSRQAFKIEPSLQRYGKDMKNLLHKLQKLQLISGEDAYRIAGAYQIESMVYKTIRGIDLGNDISIEWKSYAAEMGNQYAMLDANDENKNFIRSAWKDFLKDTASSLGFRFHDSADRVLAMDLQKQLASISLGPSVSSAKQMLHVIAGFYVAQSTIKNSKDSFLHKLSETLLDILLKMSATDKKIKAVIDDEGKNAYRLVYQHEGEPKEKELKELLLKSSTITLKNILTSLHIAQPDLDRSSDLGPEYRGPGYGSGQGL